MKKQEKKPIFQLFLAGGLTAVIWTDLVQTILMIFGAFWLMVSSFNAVGGFEELIRKYRQDKRNIISFH